MPFCLFLRMLFLPRIGGQILGPQLSQNLWAAEPPWLVPSIHCSLSLLDDGTGRFEVWVEISTPLHFSFGSGSEVTNQSLFLLDSTPTVKQIQEHDQGLKCHTFLILAGYKGVSFCPSTNRDHRTQEREESGKQRDPSPDSHIAPGRRETDRRNWAVCPMVTLPILNSHSPLVSKEAERSGKFFLTLSKGAEVWNL
jgi:hypothetical protein